MSKAKWEPGALAVIVVSKSTWEGKMKQKAHQLKVVRLGQYTIMAPGYGFAHDKPVEAPHLSGYQLNLAIDLIREFQTADPVHVVTPSRNKREGWYAHKGRDEFHIFQREGRTVVIGVGPVRFRRGAARIDSQAKFRRAGG